MISQQQAARGKVVYPQGSFAPTRGTVNPAGYIKRGLKPKRPGRDGMSDKRSGLAKKALNRKAGGAFNPMGASPALGGLQNQLMQLQQQQTGRAPLLSGQPGNKALAQKLQLQRQQVGILPGEGQGKIGAGPGRVHTQPTGPIKTDPGPMGTGGGSGPFDPNGSQIPPGTPPASPSGTTPTGTAPPNAPGQVNVSPSGTLDLPYNQEYSGEILDAYEQSNKDLMDLQMQSQTQAGEYTRNKRDLEQGYGAQKLQTLNQNAGAGTAFSSAYGLAVGNNARDYSNQGNDLETANTAFNNSIEMQRAGINENFNRRLQQAGMSAGNVAAEDAGTLGYGTSAATPVVPGPGNGSGRSNLGGKGKGRGGKHHGGGGKGKGGKGKGGKGNNVEWKPAKPHGGGKKHPPKKPVFGNTGRKNLAKRAIVKARSK